MYFDLIGSLFTTLITNGLALLGRKGELDRVAEAPIEPLPSWYQPPHKDPKTGQNLIENSKLYYEDMENYGAIQTLRWVEQGKYNLPSPETKKEDKKIDLESFYNYVYYGKK